MFGAKFGEPLRKVPVWRTFAKGAGLEQLCERCRFGAALRKVPVWSSFAKGAGLEHLF